MHRASKVIVWALAYFFFLVLSSFPFSSSPTLLCLISFHLAFTPTFLLLNPRGIHSFVIPFSSHPLSLSRQLQETLSFFSTFILATDKKKRKSQNMQEMKVGPTLGAEYLLRRQQGQKMKLKEKFVEIYDMFLTVTSTFSLLSMPPLQPFLLSVNSCPKKSRR